MELWPGHCSRRCRSERCRGFPAGVSGVRVGAGCSLSSDDTLLWRQSRTHAEQLAAFLLMRDAEVLPIPGLFGTRGQTVVHTPLLLSARPPSPSRPRRGCCRKPERAVCCRTGRLGHPATRCGVSTAASGTTCRRQATSRLGRLTAAAYALWWRHFSLPKPGIHEPQGAQPRVAAVFAGTGR